ncbi:MAG: KilA-N domain-containing protein [Sphaerospermopsis kisseleviana]
MGELIEFIPRIVNEVRIEQRVIDGFINGTAMCRAYLGKEMKFWLQNKETLNFFIALSDRFGIKSYVGKLPDSDSVRLSAKEYADIFPHLIISRRGSPENGGGTWVHGYILILLFLLLSIVILLLLLKFHFGF